MKKIFTMAAVVAMTSGAALAGFKSDMPQGQMPRGGFSVWAVKNICSKTQLIR